MTKLRKDGLPKQSGGNREGSGRPRLPNIEKKNKHDFYISYKQCLKFGGVRQMRNKVYEFLNKEI